MTPIRTISSRGNHLPDLIHQCFARQAPKTAVDELCKGTAITGHDWGVSDPPKLCSAVWLHVVQTLSEYCIRVTSCYIAGFFLNCSWWIALNRRHEKTTSDVRCIVLYKQLTEIWVSSIGVDQAFPLDCLNLFFFGCRLPQPSITLFLTDNYWKAAVGIWNGRQREHFIHSKGNILYKENQSNKKFCGWARLLFEHPKGSNLVLNESSHGQMPSTPHLKTAFTRGA